jgi:hypothetical protein
MKRKNILLLSILILAIFLTGCSTGGVVTPDPNTTGVDFYLCENLLKGFYTALSNQNFVLALSYCKSGGATFKFVNNTWNTAQEYPTFYFTYQIYNICNFSYLGKYVRFNYDKSWTLHDIYGVTYNTSYSYGSLILFEEVNGEWKMS